MLSPRDLADALGVSESSLKRWIDAGRIRASRTQGKHRRIALADALAFIRESGVPLLRPEVLGLPEAASSGAAGSPALAPAALAPAALDDAASLDNAALSRALRAGDAWLVRTWLEAHLRAGTSIAALCDGPLRASMHEVGELWKHQADGVLIEHRATDLCIQVLASLRASLEPPAGAPIAVGGAPEDDIYLVPSTMAALVLASEGLHTINLGADTPTATFHRAVLQHRPRLVWISASSPLPPGQAHELAAFLAELPAGTIGVVGGRHREAITAAAPGLRVGASMAELAALGRALVAAGPDAAR